MIGGDDSLTGENEFRERQPVGSQRPGRGDLRPQLLDLDHHRGMPQPPVVWEKDKGWFTTPPFSEPEMFDFPEGIGPVECVNVEHEEVLLMPRWVEG